MSQQRSFIQGNEAIVEGALAAGARFFGGYPITPSSEVAELAARRLPALGGVYMQMEDELASMASIVGASLAGVKSFTATSGPGLSLMLENLGVAIMAEVPCVLVDVQRSGPGTGLATKPAQADVMMARWGSHGDHSAIVLTPSSVQECFDLTVRAFELAEELRHPVLVLSDAIVGHMREDVQLPDQEELGPVTRRDPGVPPSEYVMHADGEDGLPVPLPPFGSDYIVRANSSAHDPTGYPSADPEHAAWNIRRLHDKVEGAVRRITDCVLIGDGRADVLLVAYGATARTAEQLVVDPPAGASVALLKLRSLWPFPEEEIREAAGERPVVVPEMNLGQMVREVERVLGPNYPCYSYAKSDGRAIEPGELARFIEEEVL
ncbi:MAG: 2-oxoacid:acceptor oxidoreductase subunit alpha [Bacillota bacterium]